MQEIQVELTEELATAFQRLADETGRPMTELVAEAMQLYFAKFILGRTKHSVVDIQPGSFGKPIKPWTSRAELLEGYFDRTD